MDLLSDLYEYAHDENNQELRNKLLQHGVNVNSLIIKDQLNLIKTYSFVGNHEINPNDSALQEKIIQSINEYFERDIHLIGFSSILGKNKEIPLNNRAIHPTHCDTAISLTAPELLGHYYKYGRTFFLDQIDSEDGILMVSTVNDELQYLKRVLNIKNNSYEEYKELNFLINQFVPKF